MHDNSRDQPVAHIPGVGNGGPSAPLGSALNEQEKQIHEDYEWCLRDPEVLRLHGGQVVAVHRRRVWGVGPTHTRALQAALSEPGCPPRTALALVVVPDSRPVGDPTEEHG